MPGECRTAEMCTWAPVKATEERVHQRRWKSHRGFQTWPPAPFLSDLLQWDEEFSLCSQDAFGVKQPAWGALLKLGLLQGRLTPPRWWSRCQLPLCCSGQVSLPSFFHLFTGINSVTQPPWVPGEKLEQGTQASFSCGPIQPHALSLHSGPPKLVQSLYLSIVHSLLWQRWTLLYFFIPP